MLIPKGLQSPRTGAFFIWRGESRFRSGRFSPCAVLRSGLREFRADPRALFSYSALTRDKSRVHYDRPFATFVEGHPGLVVQTDLAATLLLDLLREHAPNARVHPIANCDSRRWLHDTGPLRLFGRPRGTGAADLWAEDAQGRLAIETVVTFENDPLETSPRPAAGNAASPAPRQLILNART